MNGDVSRVYILRPDEVKQMQQREPKPEPEPKRDPKRSGR
jgi:hypothetical protein